MVYIPDIDQTGAIGLGFPFYTGRLGIPSQAIYVDQSRKDRYTPNGSQENPFKSIGAAYSYYQASDGDFDDWVIIVNPGDYNEEIFIEDDISIIGRHAYCTRIKKVTWSSVNRGFMADFTIGDLIVLDSASEIDSKPLGFDRVNVENSAEITNSVMGFRGFVELNDLTINNSWVAFSNGAKIEDLAINGDDNEPMPSIINHTTVELRMVTASGITFNVANGAAIDMYAGSSYITGSVVMLSSVTILNNNSTFLALNKTVGTYYNYAGAPT